MSKCRLAIGSFCLAFFSLAGCGGGSSSVSSITTRSPFAGIWKGTVLPADTTNSTTPTPTDPTPTPVFTITPIDTFLPVTAPVPLLQSSAKSVTRAATNETASLSIGEDGKLTGEIVYPDGEGKQVITGTLTDGGVADLGLDFVPGPNSITLLSTHTLPYIGIIVFKTTLGNRDTNHLIVSLSSHQAITGNGVPVVTQAFALELTKQ